MKVVIKPLRFAGEIGVRLLRTIAGLRSYLKRHRLGKVGFVPTMGALHPGHLRLIGQARRENDLAIASIFVNPLQFSPTEDLDRYPRPLEQDCQLCQEAGIDVVFAPSVKELYGSTDDLTQIIPPLAMTEVLCGRSRPGHFQGVATIVTKLLNLVQPDRAYFGQKDAQQLAIIRRLVADLNIDVEIVACPTVREASGLAYSSRNQYLTPDQKEQATALYRALQQAKTAFDLGDRTTLHLINIVQNELTKVPISVEYIEIMNPETLTPLETIDEVGLLAIAARVGSTRLIDNVLLKQRQPIVAIDGPAGAGKSTVARLVAQALGLLYLDSGAMYRALTWLVLKSGIAVDDEPAIAELISQSAIELSTADKTLAPTRVWINGEEVTQFIRSLEVTSQVSAIAALADVRTQLVKQQQNLGKKGGLVAEGRDIGTHVFPDAELKIFLTASVSERARRRHQDLASLGQVVNLQQLEQDIATRDTKDSTRTLSPLRKAADALEINTDGFSIAEVTDKIISLYHQELGSRE